VTATAVIKAIERAECELDGTRQFWWIEAHKLRYFVDELRCVTDPLVYHRA
jgi:hypothetical protein